MFIAAEGEFLSVLWVSLRLSSYIFLRGSKDVRLSWTVWASCQTKILPGGPHLMFPGICCRYILILNWVTPIQSSSNHLVRLRLGPAVYPAAWATFTLPGWSDANQTFLPVCDSDLKFWDLCGDPNPICSNHIWVTFICGLSLDTFLIHGHATWTRTVRSESTCFCLYTCISLLLVMQISSKRVNVHMHLHYSCTSLVIMVTLLEGAQILTNDTVTADVQIMDKYSRYLR